MAFERSWQEQEAVYKAGGKKPSVWNCVIAIMGWRLYLQTFCLLLQACSGIAIPYLIEAVLFWVYIPVTPLNSPCADGTNSSSVHDPCIYGEQLSWDGYKWGLLMFLCSWAGQCFYTWGMYISDHYDMRLKGGISHAIYRKSLRVQSVSQKKTDDNDMKKKKKVAKKRARPGKNESENDDSTTTGKIINLMTNDTNVVSLLPVLDIPM